MTLVDERFLIVIGHAWQCPPCRDKLRADPDGVLMRQGLTKEQRQLVASVAADDWITVGALAEALGAARCKLEEAMRHPRCRLRHL